MASHPDEVTHSCLFKTFATCFRPYIRLNCVSVCSNLFCHVCFSFSLFRAAVSACGRCHVTFYLESLVCSSSPSFTICQCSCLQHFPCTNEEMKYAIVTNLPARMYPHAVFGVCTHAGTICLFRSSSRLRIPAWTLCSMDMGVQLMG